MEGYFRVAACVPQVVVADCSKNTRSILDLMATVAKEGAQLAVFPELCVTAYTCGDLFHNKELLDSALDSLSELCAQSISYPRMTTVVGAPLMVGNALYNCAVVICNGRCLAVVPKSYLPNYNEFYERRWWQPANIPSREISLCGQDDVRFGVDTLIDINGIKVAIEICEDLWVPIPPSCYSAMAGAHVIANLSASDDLIGKYNYLKSLILQQSARCISAYVYASAGYGESSTDLVFDGKAIIAENGSMLAINKRWCSQSQYSITDIDIFALERDRMHLGSYTDCAAKSESSKFTVLPAPCDFIELPATAPALLRHINPLPFVPPTDSAMAERCEEILNIQAAGLAKRLDFINCKKLVIGISGGLDSTLALLVAVKAFQRLNLDLAGIIGITMPGFGTTGRTKNNAIQLMADLGITAMEIPIGASVMQHFQDIGQNPDNHDVTYENCQARERTQILMDVANKENGIVLGTGDLSELALGWATYNGDHMSMYAVNAGVPKTLVRHLVRYYATTTDNQNCRDTLLDIIDTPISPELIPADKDGNITQVTEDLVGPYPLHDFFLYYTLRYGFTPARIYGMACAAFDGEYESDVIKHWLKVFFKRFFQQQFKRSCMPDGPKVGSVCLSPRGDWRMPSDASSATWLAQIDEL